MDDFFKKEQASLRKELEEKHEKELEELRQELAPGASAALSGAQKEWEEKVSEAKKNAEEKLRSLKEAHEKEMNELKSTVSEQGQHAEAREAALQATRRE